MISMSDHVTLTKEDSIAVAESILQTQRKEQLYREIEHDKWMRDRDTRNKTEQINQHANRFVVFVNIFHWLLLCLILYKFWTI